MRRKGDDQAPKEDGNSLVPSKHTRSVVVLPRQVPDETSRSLHTSQSLKTVVRRPTEAAALEYASPSDRIGSLYSPCALYLRLPKANRKTARESSKEERERAAIAGLPDFLRPEWAARSMKARRRDQALARLAQVAPIAYRQSKSNDVYREVRNDEEHADDEEKWRAISKLRREIRPRPGSETTKESTGRLLEITPTSSLMQNVPRDKVFDPDEWDPMAPERNESMPAFPARSEAPPKTPSTDVDDGDANFAAHQVAIEKYWERVALLVGRGATHAAGAGQRRPIAQLPDGRLGGIAARVAPSQALLDHRKEIIAAREEAAKKMSCAEMEAHASDGDDVGETSANPTLSNRDEPSWALDVVDEAEHVAEKTLEEVRRGFSSAVARSMVDYELRDPKLAARLGIELDVLHAAPTWWTSDAHQTYEWKILRETGVSRRRVQFAFRRMAARLRIVEPIMLDLQHIWTDEPPAVVGDCGASAERPRCSAFASLALTDVHSSEFRRHLPLTLEAFCAHVKRHSGSVRDTLREVWISRTAKILASYLSKSVQLMKFDKSNTSLSSLPALHASSPPRSPGGVDAAKREQQYPSDVRLENSTSETDDFDVWITKATTAVEATAKAVGEASSPWVSEQANRAEGHQTAQTSVDSVLQCASMLMSRHLRTLCEESLFRVVEFFESFESAENLSTCEAAFQIALSLNEVDAEKSGNVVRLEPSLKVLQLSSCQAIDTIVAAIQEFPRPDNLLKKESEDPAATVTVESTGHKQRLPILGLEEEDDDLEDDFDEVSQSNAETVEEDAQQSKASPSQDCTSSHEQQLSLGPATISLKDEVVLKAKTLVRSALARCFEGPAKLVSLFDNFLPLVNHEMAESVQAAVAAARRFTIQSLVSQDESRSIAEATEQSLKDLGTQHDKLMALKVRIRETSPDHCNYPMFEVLTSKVKEQLLDRVNALCSAVTEAVASDNREHMMSLCAKYQEVADALVEEPTTTGELLELKKYSDASIQTLQGLSKEYAEEILERSRFLLQRGHHWSKEDLNLVCAAQAWPRNMEMFLQRSDELQDTRKKNMKMLVEGQREQLARDVLGLEKKVERLAETSSLAPNEVQMVTRRVQAIRQGLEAAQKEAEVVSAQEELLELPPTDHEERLVVVAKELAPLEKLWTIAREWVERSHAWHELPLLEVDAEDAAKRSSEYAAALGRIVKQLEKKGESRAPARRACKLLLQETVAFEQDEVPLLRLVCEPGMQQRHWDEIKRITRLSFDVSPSTNLLSLLDVGLNQYVRLIEDTCIAAAKEAAINKSLNQMSENWNTIQFISKEWRSGRILAGIDEIQQELDDQIVKTQGMRGSRYVKPYLARVDEWERMLNSLQEIIDNSLTVQAAWLYLEPIFSSDDITRQLPAESSLFVDVNQTWKESMEDTYRNPNVLSVARRDGLLASLKDANTKLECINKGLADYLEAKRISFPRFFFLSNDELLSILAETKDPLRVQPHLKKTFDGICSLEFTKDLDILAAYDGPEGKSERLEFAYDACEHKKINPRDSHGNVEAWLVEVEAIMKKSLARSVDESLVDFYVKLANSDRGNWLRSWPGQTVLTVNQITWVAEVEKAIVAGGNALENLHNARNEDLLDVVKSVRGDIPKALRKTLGSLVVMDVHNRDVTHALSKAAGTLNDPTDFDWQAHLRYYVKERSENGPRPSALSGRPGTIDCRMINASILYAYEYIGNCGRLVITPLTDRCYRTLMGAIHLNLGGAPEGPAGTGKTETTKDLAKAIAIQCVVTNCSDALDYKAMGKFFKGLAASGAWACFDEFNRIQLEVLSVIAQQVLTIQQAKARRAERFMFEGTDLPLKLTCCPFITMNPGYAGRAELPDNLKVLFRTVAMMVPDYAMIGEILLYSMGYTEAKGLAVKIVTTYKLCSEQLSSQSHYDYGMRAVMAVLRAAGNLKRQEGHLPEAVLVLRSIIDVNLPKFLSPDVPLFEGITSDLFPGVEIKPPNRTDFEIAFKDVCAKKNLQPTPYFWGKVVQIYDMMVVRHGFMIVGMPFSGKTSAWKVLADTLSLLHHRIPDEPKWTNVVSLVMNPKSVTMGQLYGQFDAVSAEWSDGCLAINYRNAAQSKVGAEEDRKWILLDGPVDAIWIENMNTVLDDNKKLCLMSGEIIAMSDTMSMIFEPMDLLVASPATVSRCGMVYLQPEQLGWLPILESWLSSYSSTRPDHDVSFEGTDEALVTFEFTRAEEALVRALFKGYVEPCYAFLRREIREMSPTVDGNLLVAQLNLFAELMRTAIPGRKAQAKVGDDDSATADSIVTQVDPERRRHISSGFVFSLVWSAGVTCGNEGRKKFSIFLRELLTEGLDVLDHDKYNGIVNALAIRKWERPNGKWAFDGEWDLPIPEAGDVQDWCYIPAQGKWTSWIDTLPPIRVADVNLSQILVPTACTAQISYMLNVLLPRGVAPLLVGPTGTGKSVCAAKCLADELPQDKFKTMTLGFSAKTTANMTQNIIDGQLTKRRKGVYGPPLGMTAVVYVDDMNMPEVETYGAQPPIELLRQIVDNGGCYDLKEKTWLKIQDTVVMCAMGPAGGGRNPTTPRFLRHFSLLCIDEFDDSTLTRIFSAIVNHALGKQEFSDDVRSSASLIVEATLLAYRKVVKSLLPTPTKSHYLFNLRDFARVVHGVLMVQPSPQTFDTRNDVMRLWTHEALRVFSDRLTEDVDRDWFVDAVVKPISSDVFHEDFDATYAHLKESESTFKVVGSLELRRLFFGEYGTPPGEENRPYAEVRDFSQLSSTMEQYLCEYNATSKKQMDLVMFVYAVEHISRISRILRMPGGNALLVGVGGSGRQSLTILASEIAGYSLRRVEISKNYGLLEWREDLKNVLREAGSGERPVTFLFSDTQINNECMIEDLNNILNSGEVPNLFGNDEKIAICEAVRSLAKEQFGRAASDMNPAQLYAYFVQRVRSYLHVVLAFSPIGDAFRDRLRKFPSLVNVCAMDWLTAWPSDALVAVAEKFLADVKLDDSVRPAIVQTCQTFHEDAKNLSKEFQADAGRITYVTPTSYLELIVAFKMALAEKRASVSAKRQRYQSGLEQLAGAETNVGNMQKELTDLQPILKQSQEDTDKLMGEIEAKLPGVREQEEIVGAEAAVAQKEADAVQEQVEEVQADLNEAMPALDAAIAALDTIKPADINEVKALAKPPAMVKVVCEAVCVMLGEKPQRIPDPDDPSKRIMDYWGPSQKMLADKDFINRLKSYDKDNIPSKTISTLRDKFISEPTFTPEAARKASSAAAGMCKWCHAMSTYDRVAKIVAPKREELAKSQQALATTMMALETKKAALKLVQDDLGQLQEKLKGAERKKEELVNQIDLCGKKLERAKQLIESLGGEKTKWSGFVDELGVLYERLTGDVLVSAGLMAYLGPFTTLYRSKQMATWVDRLSTQRIPCSPSPSLSRTLGDAVKIRDWQIAGLPTDELSVDNAITVFAARRWPLCIDPQGQANLWIRNMEKNLHVFKASSDFMRTLETAIQFGQPFLLEDVLETLDATLEPLLLKQLFKQGGRDCIRLGDSTIEYGADFKFYMTTKLSNPHFLPETSVKVSLLNFCITPRGLEDQLLGVIVAEERSDLQAKKEALVLEGADNNRRLKEIEDEILQILGGNGNILEDESAINTLNQSKVVSDDIKAKMKISEQTEAEIDKARAAYKPGAFGTQVLFFCISSLSYIEPTYSYSLPWFTNLFTRSIRNSPTAEDVTTRLENLKTHFEFSLYQNVCRSLLEKDKLLFSFLLTISCMTASSEAFDAQEWRFFLTGGVSLENLYPNPCPGWLDAKSWNELCLLSDLPKFEGLREDFAIRKVDFKAMYDCAAPHEFSLPGEWETALEGIQRLCLLRCIRPDKIPVGVQKFVIESKGEKFIRPPPFDLQACFKESVCTTPLVFVLSPGSDPMAAILLAATALNRDVAPISLGQGQGPVAESLIESARKTGSWVVLQNCHLAPSFLPRLEQICSGLTPETVHESFRLWCTTYPSPVFPVSILQNGVKMTIEPPKGLRANLIGSFSTPPLADEGFLDSCTKAETFRKLLYSLCLFHALLLERKMFGPLGWNIPYGFNASDLEISIQQLSMFLDENDDVPFKALKYCIGECNYGGRVTDAKDRRTLNSILDRFFNECIVSNPTHALSPSGVYKIPPESAKTVEDFLRVVDELPLVAEPEIFGFHENATVSKDMGETSALFEAILLAEGGGGGSAGGRSDGAGSSIDEIITATANDILNKLPPEFDLEGAQIRYPVTWSESMNTVLCQELGKFNHLTLLIKSSLSSIIKAVKGEVIMSVELENLGDSLAVGQIPALWKKRSYPSFKPLAGYVNDLLARLSFFEKWLFDKPPAVYWLSSFFFTHAFLTASKQNFARRETIPIDAIGLRYEMLRGSQHSKSPSTGVYSYGLYFEGARWDSQNATLAESEPKILYTKAPTMLFEPMKSDEITHPPSYSCPVYKTADRRGVLATTGHSTNFILDILVPSLEPESHWTQRGVAMLSQLND